MGELRAVWLIAWSTLERRRGSLLTFAGVAAAFHFTTAVALQLVGGMDSVKSTLEGYSPGIRQLLKISPGITDYTVQDHFAFTWLHPFFIGLCAAFVVSRSAEALAGDVESGSVFLLLSRPVRRWALVLGRVAEIGAGLAVILLASWLGLVVGIQIAGLDALPWDRYALLVLTAWCLFMALGAVALVVSSAASRVGIATALGTIWTLVTYVVDVLPQGSRSPLAWLNPWHHYFPPAIVSGDVSEWPGLAILLGWTAVAVLVAAFVYGRRDLV